MKVGLTAISLNYKRKEYLIERRKVKEFARCFIEFLEKKSKLSKELKRQILKTKSLETLMEIGEEYGFKAPKEKELTKLPPVKIIYTPMGGLPK